MWRKERDAWHRQKEDLKVLVSKQINDYIAYRYLFKSHHFFPLNLRPQLMLKIPFSFVLSFVKHPQNSEFVILSYLQAIFCEKMKIVLIHFASISIHGKSQCEYFRRGLSPRGGVRTVNPHPG